MQRGLVVLVIGVVLVSGLLWSSREPEGARSTERRGPVLAPGRGESPGTVVVPPSPEPRPVETEAAVRPEEAERMDVRFDGAVPGRRIDTPTDLLLLTVERRIALDRLILGNHARAPLELPLDRLLELVREQAGVPSMRADPLADRATVSLPPGRDATARELLDAMPGLAWTVRWGTLLIHAAGSEPPFPAQLVIYPVADLRDVTGEVLRREVVPWSWEEYGTEVSVVEAGPGTLMIVTTTPPVHDELDLYLEWRRRIAPQPGPAGPVVPSAEEWDAPAVSAAARSR